MKVSLLKTSVFLIFLVAVTFILFSLLIYKNTMGVLGAWGQAGKMSIYLKTNTSEENQNILIEEIKKNKNVLSVNAVSLELAKNNFNESFKEYSKQIFTDNEMQGLIPQSIEVDLLSELGVQNREIEFTNIFNKFKKNEFIEEINYDNLWFEKIEKFDKIIKFIGLFVMLVVFIFLSYLIALMLRIYISESKSEIEVYTLLGATKWSIYKVFFKDISIYLTVSLVFACAITYGLFSYLKYIFKTFDVAVLVINNLHFLNWNEIAFVLLTVLFLVLIVAYLTIQHSVDKLNQITND